MGAVEHGHVAIGHGVPRRRAVKTVVTCVQLLDPLADPAGLVLGAVCVMTEHGVALGEHGHERLLHALGVLVDERVGHGEDLGGRAVVVVHENRARAGKARVEVEQVAHVGATPGVDGLVGVTDHEEVVVVPLQDLHELVLKAVDVLELVDHDVLEARLPLASNLRVVLEDVERELDEVVVVEPEALLLFI